MKSKISVIAFIIFLSANVFAESNTRNNYNEIVPIVNYKAKSYIKTKPIKTLSPSSNNKMGYRGRFFPYPEDEETSDHYLNFNGCGCGY